MRLTSLCLLATLVASSASAASYQKIDGTIVDPLQSVAGGDLPYAGNNLEPNANLSWADLSWADLSYADLTGAFLSWADLSYADLTDANLSYANLKGADLFYAYLTDANLSDADLFDASLHHAYLTGANLSDAYLTGANLSDADLSYADLTDADLSYADLRYATFSTGTRLPDGQTVAQHGFDVAGLEAYLDVDPVSALRADNLTIVPEPTTLPLALLALTAVPLRVRHG